MKESKTNPLFAIPQLTLNTMHNLTAKHVTVWCHIENATVALQRLINAQECLGEDVECEVMALVKAYDELLQKVTVKQIEKENAKNESL